MRCLPRRHATLAFSLAALVISAALGCDRGAHPRRLGQLAPQFTVTDSQRSVRLGDYKGRVVLVNFWATWCAPCVEELPALLAMQRKLPQTTVIAISEDEDDAAYHRFLVEHNVDLLTVRDVSARANQLYGTTGYPETFIVDRDGYIRRKLVGAQDWTNPELIRYLQSL